MQKADLVKKNLLETDKVRWFFSKEGEKAYNSATSYASKLSFIYSYLCAISNGLDGIETSVKKNFAYLITECALSQELPFSRYPNIFEEKNPFINEFVGQISSQSTIKDKLCFLEWNEALVSDLRRVVFDMIPESERNEYYRYPNVKISKWNYNNDKLEQAEYKPAYCNLLLKRDGDYSEYIVLDRMIIWLWNQSGSQSDYPYKISQYIN